MAASEIDRLMERSKKKNDAIKARIAASKQRRNERTSAIANSTEASLNEHWAFLYENLSQAHDTLAGIEMATEPQPKTMLAKAKASLDVVMDRMKANNITRLGQSNVRSEIGYVVNAIVGIRHGLAEKSLPRTKAADLLPGLAERLANVRKDMQARVDHEKVDLAYQRYQIKQRQLEEARSRAMIASATPNKSRKFMSMSEAMELVQAEDTQRLRQLEAEARAAVAPEPQGSWEARDERTLNDLAKGFPRELEAIKEALKKSGITKSDEVRHVFVRGPLAILTKPQLSESKLQKANVPYKVVPFNSITMGWRGGMVGMGGGKREFIPHMFVLQDQVLVAIGSKVKKSAPPKKSSRLPVLKKPAKSLESQGNPDLIRADLTDIIQARTGSAYIDVLRETTGTGTEYLRSKQLPGMRLVWLLKRSTYDKIGPFSIESVGLPF